MLNYFLNLNPVIQALIATLFTYGVTALGASLVFILKRNNKNVMDAFLGFAAGVMVAASFWSLLSPGIEMAENLNQKVWLVISIGFLSGGFLLFIGDKIFNKFSKNQNTSFKRILMLTFSITLHNIPEGLAIGVAFASSAYNLDGATTIAAILLAIGIGIQNFPEGTAVSLPLKRESLSNKKAFFYGQLSGIVEPISGVIGALLVLKVKFILPFILAFAAGAMIYVVVQELIPESQNNEKKDLMALFTLVGFTVMMILDTAF